MMLDSRLRYSKRIGDVGMSRPIISIESPVDGTAASGWRVGFRAIGKAAVPLILSVHGSFAIADSPQPATVCEIVHHPQAFEAKLVEISGRIESDGMEYTLIIDPACPSKGIGFVYTAKVADNSMAQILRQIVFFVGKPGTQDKVITVTLVGKFTGNNRTWPKRLIRVEKVSNLVVRFDQSDNP